eukprot:2556309-Amphidinium_carterae.1
MGRVQFDVGLHIVNEMQILFAKSAAARGGLADAEAPPKVAVAGRDVNVVDVHVVGCKAELSQHEIRLL